MLWLCKPPHGSKLGNKSTGPLSIYYFHNICELQEFQNKNSKANKTPLILELRTTTQNIQPDTETSFVMGAAVSKECCLDAYLSLCIYYTTSYVFLDNFTK